MKRYFVSPIFALFLSLVLSLPNPILANPVRPEQLVEGGTGRRDATLRGLNAGMEESPANQDLRDAFGIGLQPAPRAGMEESVPIEECSKF